MERSGGEWNLFVLFDVKDNLYVLCKNISSTLNYLGDFLGSKKAEQKGRVMSQK